MEKYMSNSTGEMIVLSKNGEEWLIQFLLTGTTKKVSASNVRAGKVKDQYYPTVYGVGYYGDFKRVEYWKQAKQLWQNMLKRCYCEKDSRGYFGKATVSERWKCFSNFLSDIRYLANFDKWLIGQQEGNVKYNLDKDMIVAGNTVYDVETCWFVDEYTNKSLGAKNGKPYTKKQKGTS